METEILVSDETFQEKVIGQSKKTPVVVDFFADWCMPCRVLGPVLGKLAREHKGKFILAKMNVDSSPETSAKYGISGIPAVKMFRQGKVIAEFVGSLPEPDVKSWLGRNL